MPELPEVEVTRLGLLDRVPGRRVVKAAAGNKSLRLPMPRKALAEHVADKTVTAIDRRAKYLLFRMEGGGVMVIHLGMTGKLGIIPAGEPPAVHDHLRLLLDNGMELRFNDARRFGSVMVWPPGEAGELEAEFSARLGVEPFGRGFNVAYLQNRSRSRSMPVKNFLMDSRIVAGVGNIYANEALFAVHLHPLTPAQAVTGEEWQAIVTATRRILKKAIEEGGSTISDFLGSSGNPGYFQVHFNVYGRAGQECRRCKSIIRKIMAGGRAAFFCPECQPVRDGRGK